MKACVLASGSKGNCTYIETEKLRFLVDAGTSCAYIEKALKNIGVSPSSIDMIFLTHTHVDHVAGLRVFLKKYKPKVYLTEKMISDFDFDIDNYSFLDKSSVIEDLSVTTVKTSHDTSDSQGFIFTSNDRSIVHITDTGYIHVKNFAKLSNKNLYIFESNHDIRMLREGRYPYHLQQRILSDRGHLSNKDSAYYLSKFIGDDTRKIILIHLSEENNTPEVALNTLLDTLNDVKKSVPEVIIAKQKESTELIEV
ncbi:MAG: MBL fold metallo-hydrolase [Bacilli bacterium]|nr:MBL fold metallo-hydrolase [Bacilli bacterium]